MKFYSPLVLTSAFTMGCMINPGFAEEVAQAETGAAQTDEAAVEQSISAAEVVKKEVVEAWRFTSGEVEVGTGYVSDDSYKFGRYTGLEDDGLYAIGGLNLQFSHGRADYMRILGTNLGLESRNILLEYGRQGKFDTYIEYDQLPNFEIDSAVTPFNGAGGSDLTLPSGFVIDDPESYHDLDIETERKRLEAGFSYVPMKYWKMGVSVSRETKKGTGVISGSLGLDSTIAPIGNTVSALLPKPIDYVTDELELALDYADEKKQAKLSYHMSLFNNQEETLTWDNPFPSADRSDIGTLALSPDNEFHQLSLSGAYALNPKVRLTGLLSAGLMLQDEDFEPYTVNPDLVDELRSLPNESLDGKVEVYSARIAMTARPIQPLRFKASYKYDEHKNKSDEEQYDYYIMDTDQSKSALNKPLSYEKHQVDLNARYRFNQYVDSLLGYEYKKNKREFSDVEDNDENKVSAELLLTPRNDLDVTFKAAYMKRDSSDYQAESADQNPLVRKYYLADVEQDTAGISLYYTPNPVISIGLRGDLVKEDYTDSAVGLTEAKRPIYSLDLAWIPRENISLYAFYTREDFETKQTGFGQSERESTDSYWHADIEDNIDTYGAGIKFTGIRGNIDLGADLVYTKADSDTDTVYDDPTVTSVPYPTITNELKSFKLYALYRLKQTVSIKLSYLHEEFDSEDWALDGVEPDSAPNTILLGNESPDYDNDVVMASVIYRF